MSRGCAGLADLAAGSVPRGLALPGPIPMSHIFSMGSVPRGVRLRDFGYF